MIIKDIEGIPIDTSKLYLGSDIIKIIQELGLPDLDKALERIDDEIGYIYDNYESFAEAFIPTDIIDITRVHFHSDYVEFVYISDCGQHIVAEIELIDYLKWKEGLDETR